MRITIDELEANAEGYEPARGERLGCGKQLGDASTIILGLVIAALEQDREQVVGRMP